MSKNKIEDLYDNMQENIVQDICNDSRLSSVWEEINRLDDLLKGIISKEGYEVFDEYLTKEAELLDLERKKAFSCGYKLSTKLMIESLRE